MKKTFCDACKREIFGSVYSGSKIVDGKREQFRFVIEATKKRTQDSLYMIDVDLCVECVKSFDDLREA